MQHNFFVDFFRGVLMTKLDLSGMDHIITFATPPDGKVIHMRTYYMKLKKNPSGGTFPFPYLTQSGPHLYIERTAPSKLHIALRCLYQETTAWNRSMNIEGFRRIFEIFLQMDYQNLVMK